MKRVSFYMFLCILLFSGCKSIWISFNEELGRQYVSSTDIQSDNDDLVTITVFREKERGLLSGTPCKIVSNKKFIGILTPGQYLRWQEKPGLNYLTGIYLTEDDSDERHFDRKEIDVKKSDSIYLQLKIKNEEDIELTREDNSLGKEKIMTLLPTKIDKERGSKCEALGSLKLGMSFEEVKKIVGDITFFNIHGLSLVGIQANSPRKGVNVQGYYTTGKMDLPIKRTVYECQLSFKRGKLCYIYSDPCLMEKSNLREGEDTFMTVLID